MTTPASMLIVALAGLGGLVAPGGFGFTAPEFGTYAWPVQGPILHGFEPPPDPYGSGHRGIDIGAPLGTDILVPKDGVVAFAGWVGGSLFVSIDHPDGVRTTYSWLSSIVVAQTQAVVRGQQLGTTGHGHPELPAPHLHFGARVGTTYIDPMLLLEGGSVVGLIHLAPLVEASSPVRGRPPGGGPPEWTTGPAGGPVRASSRVPGAPTYNDPSWTGTMVWRPHSGWQGWSEPS